MKNILIKVERFQGDGAMMYFSKFKKKKYFNHRVYSIHRFIRKYSHLLERYITFVRNIFQLKLLFRRYIGLFILHTILNIIIEFFCHFHSVFNKMAIEKSCVFVKQSSSEIMSVFFFLYFKILKILSRALNSVVGLS